MWKIVNFKPILVSNEQVGQFASGNCYIILYSYYTNNNNNNNTGRLEYNVHFWIGEKSTMDSQASAAIRAIDLKK